MPVYEFECLKCGETFEEAVSLSEYEKKQGRFRCPKCKSRKVEQAVSHIMVETSRKS